MPFSNLKFLPFALLLCAGCVSSGRHQPSARLPANPTVCVQGMDARFRAQLVPVFQSRGFKIVQEASPEVMSCRTSCGGGFSMTAHISLWCDGREIAAAQASNGGWGNWVARGASKEDLVVRATAQLDRQIEILQSGIEPAPQPSLRPPDRQYGKPKP